MYIYVMTELGELDKVQAYRDKCESGHGYTEKNSQYIHGWFLVWLEEQRAAGKIKQGAMKIKPGKKLAKKY